MVLPFGRSDSVSETHRRIGTLDRLDSLRSFADSFRTFRKISASLFDEFGIHPEEVGFVARERLHKERYPTLEHMQTDRPVLQFLYNTH